MGCVFNVRFPAFNHYIVVLKENSLDFKEMLKEVLKVQHHAIYCQVDWEITQHTYIEEISKQMWSEDIGYCIEVKGFRECIELFSYLL